ncbi:MAG: hypothetical protein IT336_02550 [Thermomicrobiales bacterium]|nr:hypothetical protein [Thermomicrobiales bacterium]
MPGEGPRFDVAVVSANPAIDSYYLLAGLEAGEVQRAEQTIHTAGGKAINAARAVMGLGGRPLAIAVLGGHSGRFVAAELEREGIPYEVVWSEAPTRRCSTLTPRHGPVTVVLEAGSPCGEAALDRLGAVVASRAAETSFVAIGGSLPPGSSPLTYARLIADATTAGARTAVDCSGEPLRLAAQAGPTVIKVNAAEFSASFGQPWEPQAAHDLFFTLARRGLEVLVVTDGARGAWVFAADDAFRVCVSVAAPVSAIGAGDTFFAGLLLALGRGDDLREAAKLATAAAAANLGQVICGQVANDDVRSWLDAVHVEPAELGSVSHG